MESSGQFRDFESPEIFFSPFLLENTIIIPRIFFEEAEQDYFGC